MCMYLYIAIYMMAKIDVDINIDIDIIFSHHSSLKLGILFLQSREISFVCMLRFVLFKYILSSCASFSLSGTPNSFMLVSLNLSLVSVFMIYIFFL